MLRVVDPASPPDPASLGIADPAALDPGNPAPDAAELMRCCLVRTLLSYNGESTAKGGSELRPDVAASLPDVSTDGLTWTFHLRRGLRYAPPMQGVEITSPDFVRGLTRTALLENPPQISLSMIRGFDDVMAHRATTIAGLETPDAHTLVVRLVNAAGDLGYRLSTSLAAPIPALPDDPGSRLGVATGHDADLGAHLVASGPYMLEGSEALDFAASAARQAPVRGLVTGRSLVLVRNPSWTPAADPLRPALSDRIEIRVVPTPADAVAAVRAATADLEFGAPGPPPDPAVSEQIHDYQADPSLGHVDAEPADVVRFVSFNLAVPPFDDVHVRRAVAYMVDRTAAVTAFGGPMLGRAVGHIVPDSLEENALLDFEPFRTTSDVERLAHAQQEMSQSRYDNRHTGRCDAAACSHVVAAVSSIHAAGPVIAGELRDALRALGIGLDVETLPQRAFFARIGDPSTHTAAAVMWGWGKDMPNASDFITGLFSHSSLGAQTGYSLLGATAGELQQWGYAVQTVPSVDDRIDECQPLHGGEQVRCWTELDQYLTEDVVPVVPIVAETAVEVIPARVVAYSFDQALNLPALERIAVRH